MNKKAKVIPLPTDRTDGTLWKTTNGQLIHTHVSGEYKQKYQPFNIYIVTDDEIKEGDWFMFYGEPRQAKDLIAQPVNQGKIIGTTDLSLTLPITEDDFDPETGGVDARILPQLSQSFIESYCKNPVEKVVVEYGLFHDGSFINNNETHSFTPISNPRLTSNNELIIHPIEEKSYTRKELYKLCKVAYRMGAQNHEDATVERLDEWFNLLK